MKHRVLSSALVAAGIALAATGATLAIANRQPTPPSYGAIPDVPPVAAAAAPQSVITAPATRATPVKQTPIPATPVRLRVPAVSIDAAVTPSGVRTDRSLLLPAPAQVGWWIGGAIPGTQGSTVLAGHVDTSTGQHGALYPLSSVRQGDTIYLATTTGQSVYQVVALRSYPRQQLPASVFATTGPARLVLITCGGNYEPGRGYTDNTVVYANPKT